MPTTVYVLIDADDNILGVYSSREKMQEMNPHLLAWTQWVAYTERSKRYSTPAAWIGEWEVDT